MIVRWEPNDDGIDIGIRGDVDDDRPETVAATLAVVHGVIGANGSRRIRLIGNHPPERIAALPVAISAALGLRPSRHLVQMRRPLPVPADHPARSTAPAVRLRPFTMGRDEEAWVRVNNEAFATHPSQGTQTLATLEQTLAEPWIDLDGFLVADDDDRPGELAGFCWTRVHPPTDEDPELGEIFVIGVHPSRHGTGLGAALVLAGLDHLAWAGVATGMLYVEGDNAPARRLYDRLGFTPDAEIRIYT